MPTEFPAEGLKYFDGFSWVNEGSYTPGLFDLWSDTAGGQAWYWFGGAWRALDFTFDPAPYLLSERVGVAGGVAPLGADGKVAEKYLPARPLGLPSTRYADYTLSAATMRIVAPADGWLQMMGRTTAARGYVCLGWLKNAGNASDDYSNMYMSSFCEAGAASGYVAASLPIRRGETAFFHYVNATVYVARFLYAEGVS
jgi:hypothetical protein